jgi:hypothetical protein
VGTTSSCAEPIGNFRAAFEAISIDDCRLFRLFAEKSLQAIFGVLQHYREESGRRNHRAKAIPTWPIRKIPTKRSPNFSSYFQSQ